MALRTKTTKISTFLFFSTIIASNLSFLSTSYAATSQEETLKALSQQMMEMNKQITALKKEVATLKKQNKKAIAIAQQSQRKPNKKQTLVAQQESSLPKTKIQTNPTSNTTATTQTYADHSVQPNDPKMIPVNNNEDPNITNNNSDSIEKQRKSIIQLLHSDGLPPPDRGASFWSANMPLVSSATAHDEVTYIGGMKIGFPGGRPTIATDDGRYSFSVGLVMQEDIGSFLNSGNKQGETKGRFSQFRENLRRARIPFTFRYTDYAANITPELASGSGGLYEANFQYGGFKNTILTIGFFEPRVTMEGAESSNEGILMERPAAVELARGIAAGDSRFSIGGVTYGKRWYLGTYFTGHTFSTQQNNPNIVKDQTGGVIRVAGRPYMDQNVDVHLGLSASSAFNVAQTDKGKQITFSSSPELRLTQETLISTGALNNVSSVWQAGPEFGFRWKRFFAKAEYIKFGINRSDNMRNLDFDGYYAALNYTIFGKPRSYDIRSASFRAPGVEYDFDPKHNHWGALEISGRWSVMNLNSHKGSSDGIQGGQQTVWSGGLNWYLNPHFRIMLDYDHIMATSAPNNPLNTHGRDIDAIAARFQAAF